MRHVSPPENTHLVLAVTLTLWAGSVAAAAWEGVFAKLSPVTFAALALFAMGFAAASYGLDRALRGLAAQTSAATLWSAALAADVVLLATAFALALARTPALESLAGFPYAMSALFVAPLAVTLHIAAFARAAARRRVSSAPARSPGANPAAT
jgi:hypothetical protein